MRFIYIGGREFDGTSLPGKVVVHGVSFVLNVPTELPDSVRPIAWALTDNGAVALEFANKILEEGLAVEAELTEQSANVRGQVVIDILRGK